MEEKKQIKGVFYEDEKIQYVLNILNTIPVTGLNHINEMKTVFDILTSPIPFTNSEKEILNKTA